MTDIIWSEILAKDNQNIFEYTPRQIIAMRDEVIRLRDMLSKIDNHVNNARKEMGYR